MRAAFHFIVLEGHVGAGSGVLVGGLINASHGQVHREPVFSVGRIRRRQASVYLLTRHLSIYLYIYKGEGNSAISSTVANRIVARLYT